MAQRLFKTGKIPCFVDSYAPGVEKRRGEEVSVLSVTFRVQPFDAKLATALDDGVGEDSNIKPTVFTLTSGEPKPHFTRHDFKLALERQNLELYASPDTTAARIALLQAKITGTYVRSQKDVVSGLALVFKATFGPVGRDELEAVHALHRSQTFVTFREAEPLLGADDEDEGDDEDLTDADEKARVIDGRVPRAPMWDDDAPIQQGTDEGIAAAADQEPARRVPPRHADTKARVKAKQKTGRKR